MSDLTGGGAAALGGATARAEGQFAAARTSVWWDIENCAVPRNCDPHLIALNISSALDNLGYSGRVSISAYGDTNKIPDAVQRALDSTGVSLNHIPAGVKDASDKKILVDMLFWAMDNPPPSNCLLILGDRDFSNAVHQLGLRKYNVLLAQPQYVSSALVAAAKSVWEWPSLVVGGPPMLRLPEACRSYISDSVKASQPSVFSGNQNAMGNDNDNGNGNGRSANNGNGNGNGRAANSGSVKADNDRYIAEQLKNPNQPISISRVPSNELRLPVPGNQENLTSGTSDNFFHTTKPGILQQNHSFIQGESDSHPQSAAYKPTSFEGLDAKQFNDTGHHAFVPNLPNGTSGPIYTPTRSDYPDNMGNSPIENGGTASNNQLRPRDLSLQNGNLTTLNSQNPPSSRSSAALPPHDRPVSATFPPHTRPFLQPINLQHARSGPPSTQYPPENMPIINYLDTAIESNKPASKKRKIENDKHLKVLSGTPVGAALPPDGFSGTPMGAALPPDGFLGTSTAAAFPPDILDMLGNILSTLKDEKMPPTEANIEDCIRYGEMNIQYFNVRGALDYALKSQYLIEHKSRKRKRPPYYTKKEEPLWKCLQDCTYEEHAEETWVLIKRKCDQDCTYKKHPKKTWDSIKEFLSSAEGQCAMQFSQCRYQAAIRLKKACLKTTALGDILLLLNVMIDYKKWILPHATGWQPLSVTCPNTKSSDASTSLNSTVGSVEELCGGVFD